MAKYVVLSKRTFPGQRADGSLGNRYEIIFSSKPLVERDSIMVDDLDPQIIDREIQNKISQHEAVSKLGQ